jgi:hypothetical protein
MGARESGKRIRGRLSSATELLNPQQSHFKNDVSDGEFGNYLYGKPCDYGGNSLESYEFLRKLSVQFNAKFGVSNLKSEIDRQKPDGKLRIPFMVFWTCRLPG